MKEEIYTAIFQWGLGKLLTLCESQNLTNAKDAQATIASIMGKIKYSRMKNDHMPIYAENPLR